MVTVLQIKKKSDGICTAYFSNESDMDFTGEELCAFHITEGREYDDEHFFRTIMKVKTERAKSKIIASVLYAPKTAKQVKEKILKEGFEPEVAEALTQELIQKNYVNDRDYAERYVRRAMKTRPDSQAKIRADLRSKGIDRSEIEKVMEELNLSDDEMAIKVLEKKLRGVKVRDYNKLYGFLSRKGFSSGSINRALKHFKIEKKDEY